MQAPSPPGVLFQPGPQQVGEEMVIAPPAPDIVQLDHEQPGPVHLFEQFLAVVAARDRVTQRPAQTFQHRRLEQEVPQVGALPFEDLLTQVVQDVPVAAGESGHEAHDVGLVAQGQRGQLQPDGPALGPLGQRGHRGKVEFGHDLAEQFGRLIQVEPEIGCAHLTQLAPAPVPGQRQRRIGAAGHRDTQLRRTVLEQEPDRGVHAFRVDQVVIVQHQQHVRQVRLGHEIVDQRGDQRIVGRRRRGTGQRAHPPGQARAQPVQRGQHVPPEPDRVVVPLVERKPGHWLPADPGPLRQQNRLAVAGRRRHQDQPAAQALLELVRQPGPGHQAGPRPRHVQLGPQQDVRFG